MGLFKPDFFRSLLIGFAAGGLLVIGSVGSDMVSRVIDSVIAPSAEAAAPAE